MKKIYFLLIALCFFATTKAQIVNIPDANFKALLLQARASSLYGRASTESPDSVEWRPSQFHAVDTNGDGQIQVSEAKAIKFLSFSGFNTRLQITSLEGINSFTNLEYLSCTIASLKTLDVTGLINLRFLGCSSNLLTSLSISGLTKLEVLSCQDNQLSSLNIETLSSLKSLSSSGNQLLNLNAAGLSNLQYMDCSNNKLSNLVLDSNLINLETLKCSANQIPSLNLNGLKKLKLLDFRANQVSSADFSGLNNLQELLCDGNKISNLDLRGLQNLKILSCSGVGLGLLTDLNVSGLTNLKELTCDFNKLTSLNLKDLINLERLHCEGNQLTSLDVSGLTKLDLLTCPGNQMVTLNLKGCSNLGGLVCRYNQLTSLDLNEQSKLHYLSCENNNLSTLFIKNNNQAWDSYSPLGFGNNPNLKYICANEKDIALIKSNYSYSSACQVNSYCNFVPGGVFYEISGTNKIDLENDGCGPLDKIYPNLKFSITDGIIYGSWISDSSGIYSIPVQTGTHTISPIIENADYFTVSPQTAQVTFPAQISPFVQNFCITPNGVRPDLEITLIPLQPARPGFDAKYKIIYKNKGNTTQSGTVSLEFDDEILDFVSVNPAASSQTVNKLSWSFTNLKPFDSREVSISLNLNGPTEIPAINIGRILKFTATIASQGSEETLSDNTFTLNQTVVGSYDPNDKTCLEGSTISPSLIDQYVHYMIRFENSGTANAQNIVVKDMIDLSKFDISTLVPTSASHSFVTNISAGNKVEFIFENINLPFDDANNDGYIAFKIKTLPTLVVGDSFTNDASIYFDYNFPIVTNKASSTFKTLGTQDFEFATYFTLYPNPAKSVLNISSKETIEVKSISIYNTLGQLVLVVPNAEKVSNIDVSSLRTGNYFIKVNSDKGSSNARFVKE